MTLGNALVLRYTLVLAALIVGAGVLDWLACAAFAGERIAGPVVVDSVVSVYDGDTFTARAAVWPGLEVTTGVRVRGVDTPEIRGQCPEERRLAAQARDRAAERLFGAERVELRDIERGKYAGRVVATVVVDGERLDRLLIGAGLGRAYDGGTRRGWCSGVP